MRNYVRGSKIRDVRQRQPLPKEPTINHSEYLNSHRAQVDADAARIATASLIAALAASKASI